MCERLDILIFSYKSSEIFTTFVLPLYHISNKIKVHQDGCFEELLVVVASCDRHMSMLPTKILAHILGKVRQEREKRGTYLHTILRTQSHTSI